MAFNEQETQLIQFGLQNGKTQDEVRSALVNFRAGRTSRVLTETPESVSFVQDLAQDVVQIGTDIKSSAIKGMDRFQEIDQAQDAGEQGMFRSLLQKFGTGAKFGADVIGSTVKGAVKAVLPQSAEDAIKSGVQTVVEPIITSAPVQSIVEFYGSLDDKQKRDVDAVLGVGQLALAIKGAKGIADTTKAGAGFAKSVAGKAVGAADDVVANVKSGLGGVADSARGVRDVIKPIIAEAKTLPGKAKVNLAQSRAAEATISQLKPAGQTAVRSGVELPDVKALYTIPKSTAANLKPLVRSVQKFAAGSKTANPLEVVGKPMIQGLKTAQSKANTIGAKLGKVADKLPKVTAKQVTPQVFNSLKKVRGLEGLTVSKNGVLNFKNTTLATAGTKADRMAIQKIFTDAVKTGTGKQKHLLRQELFEILGGKKSGGLQITGTQERAFEAVRKGLSNTLDDLNPTYKSLNMQFAKTISPVKQLQKLLKSSGVDDDLLNMKAGLLARRLTSFAKSNPEIRQILRDLDKVIGKQGTTSASIEQLQDVYNILDKYYDIAGQTSFQGQVTAGVVKAAGGKGGFSRAVDLVEGQVGKLVGETSIVKQRAIEAVLKDLGLMN